MNWIWPDLSTEGSAKNALKQGVYACVLIAVIDLGVAAYTIYSHRSFASYGASIWLDGLLFALIGCGIWRRSRIASVLGVLLMAFEIVDKLRNHHQTFNILTVVLLLAIMNAARASFALESRSKPAPASWVPDRPQSLG